MNSRKLLAHGVVLLAVGGCAGQPKPAPPAPMAVKTNPAIFDEPAQFGNDGRPAASGNSPADTLIERANDYARANGFDTPNPPVVPPRQQTRAGGPAGHRTPAAPVDTDVTGGDSAALGSFIQAVPDPRQASAKMPPRKPLFNGAPREAEEGEDFNSTQAGSDAMAQRLLKRIHENPHDLSNLLDWMLYGMLNDDQSADIAALSSIQPDDRELLATLVDGLSNFRSTVRQDANMLQTDKMRPLQDMVERLRGQADLAVPVALLCKRVDAYGKYDPITPARFPAGHENRTIVYCEVENFLAKQNTRQLWETRLSEQVSLYTDSGLLVWSDDRQSVTDECRERRHDFFCFNKITLPASLTVGRYVLKVSIEDENTEPSRVAEASVALSITAQ